ncbi:predicted protein [Micromonas commoda]|uniref:Uncharacterized protein n=1 Tax=Micromonas commoda (strain RCC299 / NOUM17 / CCMP2709) TaxID=296587 RepID=C1EBP2_MICCC|nr:predicted protein [Micromonas commoda]ACO65756.1 predicted protein [Micromonas commoda]|eukprot:XP_002504498.1 predicted protein [Micromonas commoda]
MSGSTAAATNPAASSPARANADDAPSGDGLGAAAKAKLKGLLAAAFGSSVTTVRIDVQAPRLTRERRQRKAYGGWGDAPARAADGDDGFTRGGITSHNFSVEQTRLQVKQKWETGLFEQQQTGGGTVIKSRLDLGAGLDVGLLRAEVVPDLRVRCRLGNGDNAPSVYLRALPEREIVARGRIPLANTGVFLALRLEVPLRFITEGGGSNPFTPKPVIAAQLCRPSGTGPHLSTGGLEFDETLLTIGRDCALRVAANLDFPREYPPSTRGGGPRLDVRNLGVKFRKRWYEERDRRKAEENGRGKGR